MSANSASSEERTPGYRRLLCAMETVLARSIRNKGNPIRYPVTVDLAGVQTRARRTAPAVLSSFSFNTMSQARYVFGANELYIYQSLDALVQALSATLADPRELWAIVEQLENHPPDQEPEL